ncbi:glycosyltransferase family 90 protein [Mycena crocata]|nr:glycosyltransferase family 90 protein [Mycena crocata]
MVDLEQGFSVHGPAHGRAKSRELTTAAIMSQMGLVGSSTDGTASDDGIELDDEHYSPPRGYHSALPSPTTSKTAARKNSGGMGFDSRQRDGFDGQRNAEKQQRRRLTPRAAYGWLHEQSGYIFLLVVTLAFVRAGLHAATPASERPSYSSSFTSTAKSWIPSLSNNADSDSLTTHPIPALMDAAARRYRNKLAHQSKTLPAAVAEYKRRYKRAPPRGFERWYAFAVRNNFVMVDEFDSVEEDLKPFWGLEGRELRRRAALDSGRGGEDGQGEGMGGCGGERESGGFQGDADKLPEMDFPINAKAEGRVVVPWEHAKYPNATAEDSFDTSTFRPDYRGEGSVWDSWRRTCAAGSPARRMYSSIGPGWAGHSASATPGGVLGKAYEWRMRGGSGNATSASVSGSDTDTKHLLRAGSGLEFVSGTGANAGTDFCQEPGARYEQGHFFSDWRVLPALLPVFSPARAAGFADIRIPSHYYYGGTKRYTYAWDAINLEQGLVDPMEIPWSQKYDAVFWRGASTGGGSSPRGFGEGYQRHRFLRMSSVGVVPGTLADAQRTTAVTFALPPVAVPRSSSNSDSSTADTDTDVDTDNRNANASADSDLQYTYQHKYKTVGVPLSALNADIMDAAFTKAVVPFGSTHRLGDSVELGVAWGYKYLLDLDGMGYSGRFMAFLASDSVPVKATVYDEYFSGWIEPWVHYIPLSTAYSEIYNIVSYFSGPPPSVLRAANLSVSEFKAASGSPHSAAETEKRRALGNSRGKGSSGSAERDAPQKKNNDANNKNTQRNNANAQMNNKNHEAGNTTEAQNIPPPPPPPRSPAQDEADARLRRIARAGKQWKQTVGRKVDMEVYVYRLALEWARLWSDDREAMSSHG